MPPSPHLSYPDGIRGIAAFFVFAHHFLLAFYPAYYSFDMNTTHCYGWDVAFGRSVFSVFTNGNFWVHVFFVLSGMVLARAYFLTGNISIPATAFFRRYIRLYIPVAASLVLAAILLFAGLYFNRQAAVVTLSDWWLAPMWQLEHPVKEFIRCMSYDTMFNGNNNFNSALWTISFEFYGAMLIFTYLIFTHFVRYRALMLIIILSYFYFTGRDVYFSFFLGLSLNYISRPLRGRYMFLVPVALLFLAAVFGSWPTNGRYDHTLFAHLGNTLMDFRDWFHTIAAYLLVLAFVLSSGLQRFLSLRLFRFMGRISFSFYLLHIPLIGSLSCWLLLRLQGVMHYHYSVVLIAGITLAVLVIAAWLMTRYIDVHGIRLSKSFARLLLRTDEGASDDDIKKSVPDRNAL